MTTTVGLKALKNKLSEYIRLAASGETIMITDRGRIVAELLPPQTAAGAGLHEQTAPAWQPARSGEDSFVERGVSEGWLTPARIRDGSPPPRMPVRGLTFEQLMADLERDREDR